MFKKAALFSRDGFPKDCVGNSLLQILELRFGHKAKLLLELVSILPLIFCRGYEAESWPRF